MDNIRRSLILMILVFSIHLSGSYLNASVTVEAPSGPFYQGETVTLVVNMTEITPLKGELYFRPSGITYYQRIPIEFRDGGSAEVTIPATSVVSPGLEYYIEIVTSSGEVVTSPSTRAIYSPYTLKVLTSHPLPEAKLISPDPSFPIREREDIVIEFTSRPEIGTVNVFIDNTDITPLIDISGKRIVLSSALLESPGRHTLVVEVEGKDGMKSENSWVLMVAEEREEEKFAKLKGSGGISFNYSREIKTPSGPKDDTVSGNLNLGFDIEGRNWNMKWEGINIQYVEDTSGDNLTISSGFYVVLRKGEHTIEYGDITVQETQLTAPSFARRGVQAKLKGFDTELHLFNVSTGTVSGWNSGIGDADRQVYGFSVTRPLISKTLPFTLVYITGRNQAVNGFNTASTRNRSEGDILGIRAAYNLFGIDIEGEVAGTRYDSDTTDDMDEREDTAGTLSLSTKFDRYSIGFGYYYYGPDFASIANPNFTNDREGFSGSVGTSFGPSTLSLSFNRGWDNVEEDPTRPVVYSTSGTLSWGLSPTRWPSISLSYTRSMQDSTKEPAGTQEVDNINDTVNMGLSLSGDRWSASLGGNYGKLNDRAGGLDSETRGVNLSGSLTPFKGLSLGPSLGFTESKSSDVLKRTRIASLTAGIPILSPYMNTSLQVSYTLSDASDGSQDSTDLNGSWRLSLNLHEFIKKWIDYGTEVLALSASYSKIDDNVNPANSGEDISVFLSINLFAPISFLWGF